MAVCYGCGGELKITDRVGRSESCPNCRADLHCCRNCQFYDPTAYNECREIQAERVLEKEKSNFCDYFQIAEQLQSIKATDAVHEARRKLEGLFKKQ